jgi:hypothetical protein
MVPALKRPRRSRQVSACPCLLWRAESGLPPLPPRTAERRSFWEWEPPASRKHAKRAKSPRTRDTRRCRRPSSSSPPGAVFCWNGSTEHRRRRTRLPPAPLRRLLLLLLLVLLVAPSLRRWGLRELELRRCGRATRCRSHTDPSFLSLLLSAASASASASASSSSSSLRVRRVCWLDSPTQRRRGRKLAGRRPCGSASLACLLVRLLRQSRRRRTKDLSVVGVGVGVVIRCSLATTTTKKKKNAPATSRFGEAPQLVRAVRSVGGKDRRRQSVVSPHLSHRLARRRRRRRRRRQR